MVCAKLCGFCFLFFLFFFFLVFVFFFQAEDGIRDVAVTGVQTCALPILSLNTGQSSGHLTGAAHHLSPLGGGLSQTITMNCLTAH